MSTGTQIQLADGVTGMTGKQIEAKINAAFEEMESWGDEYAGHLDFAKNNVKVIRMITDGAALVGEVVKENGQWVIEIDATAFNHKDFVTYVAEKFYFFAEAEMQK